MRKFDLSLRSSRSSYFATFRHQLTILSKTDALDEEKWLNMLGTFVKDWFRYESHFVHGRDSLVDILKERGLLSNILHRNFTRRQVAIQNRVASNIGISQSTFSVKVLNLFSRSRRKTNKRKSKHSAMLRNKETRHRMFIGLLNTTRKLA